MCTKRRTPAALAAASAFSVPLTLTCRNSASLPYGFTCAAAWNTTSCAFMPSVIARTSSRSPRTGSAPAPRTAIAEASLRARALTATPRPSTSSVMRRLPRKPDPPVTNARFTRRNLLASTTMSEDTIRHPDGRVELRAPEEVRGSRLHNEDLAPVPVVRRTWTTWDYAALWISMAHCIPTYTLASSLIGSGMSWWQALLTILIGNVIVLAPILLNSHAGTKYGIPFPVFARAAYGTTGSNLPALMRALIACGWFGINAWIGGQALQMMFIKIYPGWRDLAGTVHGYPGTQWISFLLFWALNLVIIYRGMELVRRVERFAAPFVLVVTAIL